EQVANLSTYPSQRFKSFCYYDNDDYDYEKSNIPLNAINFQIPPSNAIIPVLPTIAPEDSLSMGDEHLSTNPEKESDKVIKSSVKNLVPIPSESKDLTDYESESDMPVCDDSSSKNEGLDDIVSIPPGKEIDHLDAIPDSVQSLFNRANTIVFLIEEFARELAPIDPIPPGIVEAEFDLEEDIRLIEKLLNGDSSPYSPEELNFEIPDAIIESFSPYLIPIEDSDSIMEEIDIFLAADDSIPPGIENDDYDSKGGVLFLEELLNDDSLSLPKYESFHVDFYNVPSSPRPPEKPSDDDVYLDIEPDTGVLTTKVVDDISTRELYVYVPNILPTLYPEFDTLLPFSSENEDKVFNPGILISKKEKSPHLLSHRGFKVLDIAVNDKNEAKRIKPSTGMERGRKTKAEGETRFGRGFHDYKLILDKLRAFVDQLLSIYDQPLLMQGYYTREQSRQPVMTREEDDGISVALDPQRRMRSLESFGVCFLCEENERVERALQAMKS
ncbi:hypothetical protein Tco_0737545, partial [Tanacetum coccineum]